jgi:hypothetical protein
LRCGIARAALFRVAPQRVREASHGPDVEGAGASPSEASRPPATSLCLHPRCRRRWTGPLPRRERRARPLTSSRAREIATLAYAAAKRAARVARTKGVHDDQIAAAHWVQADALEIEAAAKAAAGGRVRRGAGRGRSGRAPISAYSSREQAHRHGPRPDVQAGATRRGRCGTRRRPIRASCGALSIMPSTGRGADAEQRQPPSGTVGRDRSARPRLQPGKLPALSGKRPGGYPTTRMIETGVERA